MNTFKRIAYLAILLSTVLFLVACTKNESGDIVTTLYPQYDIAKQITKGKLTVTLTTPIGSEVHGFNPTPKDIVDIKNAKLFIYTSNELEHWVNKILNDTNSLNSLNLFDQYNQTNQSDDIHFWTDPIAFIELINIIRDEIIAIDEINKDFYTLNALEYSKEVTLIHEELLTLFNTKEIKTFYFFGHNALQSFTNRYNFNITSLSSSFQPDAELTPQQIIALKNSIRDNNAKYLFVEELIDLAAVTTLKNELHNEGYSLTILELHGYHNISFFDYEEGVSYAQLLKRNYEHLKLAIND